MKLTVVCCLCAATSLAAASGLAAAGPLTAKDVKLDGMKLTIVPYDYSVQIEPLPIHKYTHTAALKPGTPGWGGPVYLPRVAWTFRAMTPGSLVVTPADQPDTKLAKGADYLLDPDWATLAHAKGSKHPAGTKLKFSYTCTGSRFDLIERTAAGKIVLTKGVEDPKGQPHLPEFTSGRTPLLSVYLAPNTTKLTMANINLIDLEAIKDAPVSGAEHLAGLREKLRAGKGVTIVFVGDSITAQTSKDFRDGRGSFVDRTAAYLQKRYPGRKVTVTPRSQVVRPGEKQIVIVKAGVGGDDTPRGLRRIDKDVLAHKPDAVVMMFGVNDENKRGSGNSVPVPKYKANLTAMVEKVQAAGGEVFLMTTSMKNLDWIGTVGNLDEYAAAARQVAKARKACLVDNFKSWQELPKRGYNYMVYLGTCINHPCDLGHELFFQNLKAALEAN